MKSFYLTQLILIFFSVNTSSVIKDLKPIEYNQKQCEEVVLQIQSETNELRGNLHHCLQLMKARHIPLSISDLNEEISKFATRLNDLVKKHASLQKQLKSIELQLKEMSAYKKWKLILIFLFF